MAGFGALALLVAATPRQATANAGDLSSPDFAASAPLTYSHDAGGGAYNDGSAGRALDTVESLEGSDLGCSDTVSFLTHLGVVAEPTDQNQTVELVFRFTAQTTGQNAATFVDVLRTQINYGLVENGDGGTNPGVGVFGLDAAISDDRQTILGGDTGSGGSQVKTANGSRTRAPSRCSTCS